MQVVHMLPSCLTKSAFVFAGKHEDCLQATLRKLEQCSILTAESVKVLLSYRRDEPCDHTALAGSFHTV